ncbi:MAG: hypothetical protein Q8900_05595 [Bacillota bacterium]|nr:hypothetical protein [Bacillota bacterium]
MESIILQPTRKNKLKLKHKKILKKYRCNEEIIEWNFAESEYLPNSKCSISKINRKNKIRDVSKDDDKIWSF